MKPQIRRPVVERTPVLMRLFSRVYDLAPALARPTPIAGSAGVALCLIWSLRAAVGSRNKALPFLILGPVKGNCHV
jgi:hypothetical protein